MKYINWSDYFLLGFVKDLLATKGHEFFYDGDIYVREFNLKEIKKLAEITKENGEEIVNEVMNRVVTLEGDKTFLDVMSVDKLSLVFLVRTLTYPEPDYIINYTCDNEVDDNGDGDKPIWVIEFGYRTPSPEFSLGHSAGVVTEEDQGTLIVDAMELASTWSWLERFYIYEWMDSSDPNLGYWGLIREDYVAPYDVKPSYYAVKDFISLNN